MQRLNSGEFSYGAPVRILFTFWRGVAKLPRLNVKQFHRTSYERLLRHLRPIARDATAAADQPRLVERPPGQSFA